MVAPVSIASATRLFRMTGASLNLTRFTTQTTRFTGFSKFSRDSFPQHQRQYQRLFLSPVSSEHGLTKTGAFFKSQPIRGFSTVSPRGTLINARLAVRSTLQQQQLRTYSSNHEVVKRRPFRFLFKVMAVSTALVALPAVLIFGVPLASVIFVPIVVGGAVGGVLLLTGGLIFFVLPILAIGGAFAVWTFSMPAAMTFKELNKILKRANKNADQSSTALSALGPDWEIQPARNNEEWFRWRFPSIGQPVDQLSVRMAVFDPNDKSERKQNTFWLLDKMEGERTDEEEWTLEKTGGSHVQKKSSHFEFRNNSDEFVVENLSVKRDRDHLLIQIEDDGPKILAQKWGKKYLELAKIVDRASSEMEAAHPGLQLGDQVVLVQRKDRGSFWDKFSPYGDLAVRVPFSRNWVHDVTDE